MDAPRLELKRQGSGAGSLLLLPGYLTEKKGMGVRWSAAIDEAGFLGNVFQLRWDSSGMATGLQHAVPLALAACASAPAAVASTVAGIRRLRGHWSKVKTRARLVGTDFLQAMISEIPGEITIVAHSVGARVAYFGLHSGKLPRRVSRLVMCGGAVRRDSSKDWAAVAERLDRGLYNVRNQHDWVLKGLFKLAEGGRTPVGLKPIKAAHPNIHDGDETGRLPSKLNAGTNSHSRYFRVIGPYITPGGSVTPAPAEADARKHCRVCGKRISYGIKFQTTARFYCRGCGHRTHVACAASVSDKLCSDCG